jgi:hypothetical protein
MLGGGNPVSGSNPSGIGQTISYIGNHAYATSGEVTDSSSGSAATTLLKFSTGNSYIVATINVITTHEGSAAIFLNAIMDGQNVFTGKTDDEPNLYMAMPLNILIPPYTNFELKYGSSTNTTMTAVLVGDVYA